MNVNNIIAQTMKEIEGILREMAEAALLQSEEKTLTIHSMELLMTKAISGIIQIILVMAGTFLSNAYAVNAHNSKCSKCGRKMVINKRNAELGILSIFGRIPIVRDTVLCRPCGEGYGVIDRLIKADGKHRMTNGLIDLLAFTGQLIPSFEKGKEAIKKYLGFTGLTVSHELIQEVSEEIGKEIFERDETVAEEIYENQHQAIEDLPEGKKKDCILYIMMDGSMINIRDISDPNKSGWKEIKLGVIFTDKDIFKINPDKNKILNKRYVSYLGSAEDFKKFVLAAAIEQGYGRIKKVVVIGDGALWIWNLAKEVFPDAVAYILDSSHLKENIYQFAEFLYPEDKINQERWATEIIDLVHEGNIDEAIERVTARMPDKLPDNIVNLSHYMNENKERMRYNEFKAKGYFIGSGSVESGHKVVVQQRMKQAGMRWSRDGAQYIAALRARYQSNMWDNVSELIAA